MQTYQPSTREGDALVWRLNHETLRIEAWGADSLRVRVTMAPAVADLPGALLAPQPQTPEIEIGEGSASIRNGTIRAEISAEGRLSFYHTATGAPVLSEPAPRFTQLPARHFKSVGGNLYHIEARFDAVDGEHCYGLGQHPHGRLDQKGCVVDLVQRNTEVCIPFLLSCRDRPVQTWCGFLWHNPAIGRVDLGRNGTRWVAEAARQMDYWVTAGSSPAEVLSHYADAVGHAPMLPEWAAGFWQCKLRYTSQDELLGVAREYQRRKLPLSVIVADFLHWTRMGEWRFDPVNWPDPDALVVELEEMGVKLMVSVWPTVNVNSANTQEMEQRGLLVCAEDGLPAQIIFTDKDVPPGERAFLRYYDATHPEARRYLWERIRAGYYRHGVKAWWLDACEPDFFPAYHTNARFHLGSSREVGSLYPFMHQSGFYEGMRGEGETEVLTLCRSAWAGSQRYGAAVWSGDIPSTFESLAAQVPAGLNIGLSGIPWWTTDIGGFYGGDPEDPYFRELIVRWFQYGVFCPLFRLHGHRVPAREWTGGPNEVWAFGSEAYAIIRGLLALRERLRPYLMAQMRLAHTHGAPPMRPLFFDFPDDPVCREIGDQFMLGPDLLVAPVTELGSRGRRVYLPAGPDWVNAHTGRRHHGGRWLQASAPIHRIPLFLRGGTELPIVAEGFR